MTDTLATRTTPGWEHTPTAVDGVAVVGLAGVFWLVGGLPGAALAFALGAALFALPNILVVALGQVGLAALLPEDPAVAVLLVGELPLVVMIAGDIDRRLSERQLGTALLVAGIILTVSVAATAFAPQLWIAGLAVLGMTALLLYGGHRYAIVRYKTSQREEISTTGVTNRSGPEP